MKELSWDNCPICGAKLYREYWGLTGGTIVCWRYSCSNMIEGKLCPFGVKLVNRPKKDTDPIMW